MTTDRKKTRTRGLMGMAGENDKRPKQVGVAGPVLTNSAATESWLNLAFAEKYTDTRKLWGSVRTAGWRPSGMGEECDRKSVLGMFGYRGGSD